jgi:hypothetical protein
VKLLITWVEPPPPEPHGRAARTQSKGEQIQAIWNVINKPVAKALTQITGQSFETKRQWDLWLKTPEARRMGIR